MNKKFKLEKILEYRENALEREKMKLSELNMQDKELSDEMNSIAEDMKNNVMELEQEKSAGHFQFLEMYNKYLKQREQDFILVAQKRELLNKEIAKQKEILRKALNDLKIMEKLKKKHLMEYAQYMKKQEELQIDEINITRPHNMND